MSENCVVCGEEFDADRNTAKYCQACRREVRAERCRIYRLSNLERLRAYDLARPREQCNESARRRYHENLERNRVLNRIAGAKFRAKRRIELKGLRKFFSNPGAYL
jgi:hypothetical protein